MPYEYDVIETQEASTHAVELTRKSADGWELVSTTAVHSGSGSRYSAVLRRFVGTFHSSTETTLAAHPGIEVGSNATEAPAGLSTGATDPAADAAETNLTADDGDKSDPALKAS